MQFSDILASIIHDMKNSLGIVINTLEDVSISYQETDASSPMENQQLSLLHHEAKRLNNNLIELLTLYKIENERIAANIDEVNVEDFLEEVMIDNQVFAEAQRIDLTIQCEKDLVGFFDEGLMRGVMNNLIGNGLRYTQSELLITAAQAEGFLVLKVADNGEGYPQSMLEHQRSTDDSGQVEDGNTHLGIYFATLVAQMHHNKEKRGFIQLSNGEPPGGGCFAIWLP